VRVLAVTLAVLLVADELLFLFGRDLVEQFTQKPLPAWLPAQVIGPFLAYEIVALLALFHLHRRLDLAARLRASRVHRHRRGSWLSWGSHLGPLFSRNGHQPEPCH
jgi:hypothetical protein